jgi:DNA (cytosine-5)-methyltransferase 1
MNCIHLFNGIGGFALAAGWMGWNNIASVEIDPFCNKVTGYHWPNMKQHGDIKTTDFTIYRGTIDILTGGFPCQPFSQAGARKGTDDNRHLWPEMFRAIREIQPRYVVGENVPGLLNISDGLVFEQVCADLESEGYEVQPVILPACAVNAPHRRDRVWIVAYRNNEQRERQAGRFQPIFNDGSTDTPTTNSNSNGQQRSNGQHEEQPSEGWFNALNDVEQVTTPNTGLQRQTQHEQQTTGLEQCSEGNVTDTESKRMEGYGANRQQVTYAYAGERLLMCSGATGIQNWDNFPTQSPVCSRNDEFPGGLDGITFPKWRAESIKAYGNAIVPSVAYQIFKAIAATL